MKRSVLIIISVATAVVVATGIGVLIWWSVADHGGGNGDNGDGDGDNGDGDGDNGDGDGDNGDGDGDNDDRFETIMLEGPGFGDIAHRAAFTRISDGGDMFWWFYPTLAGNQISRPIVLWLDGVVGLPPSLLANFGMIGPYDFNLERRNDSWINEYNLLFVDGPLGAGFSTVSGDGETPGNLENTTNHLLLALESFYEQNQEFIDAPLYIFGQGYGAQLAISLAIGLSDVKHFLPNLKGIVLGNAIISPAVALTKLGFYLEELGYIDSNGRDAIENFSAETVALVEDGQYEAAYNNFLSLDNFVNDNANAVAVNLGRIVEKLTRESGTDYFSQVKYLEKVTGYTSGLNQFMEEIIAPVLGISNPSFDERREDIVQGFRETFMVPATDKVEDILNNYNISVTIYNGNLDAVSNTPGQLEWVNNLQWAGQAQFLNSPRRTLVVNGLVEGYFRETDKLTFYWINAAGLSAPLDNPAALGRIIQRIIDD